MCGINGIIYLGGFHSGKPEDFHFGEIRKMNEAIAHRGPDGEGFFIDYPYCIGHRRLSIIDLSDNGNQPMSNEDGSIIITYNGEIYNYKELIPALKEKGHIFKSNTDTEVVLHAYEEYGEECVRMFNGMWAFAIVDLRKKILFASRDRFGVKPFYYFLDKNMFAFSSEAKGIISVTGNTHADHAKVFNYLAYGYRLNDGTTFFRNINELLPAHNLTVSGDKVTMSKYWELPFEKEVIDPREELRQLVYDSVRIRYRSDVPVSILLSGGIDSGIIAFVTQELIDSGKLDTDSVSSYSAVFPGFRFDESRKIGLVLDSCKSINGNFVTPVPEHISEKLEKFAYGMDEPVFSATAFVHYLVMKEIAAANVKVALNGQGADEAWCGYGKYIIGYHLRDMLSKGLGEFGKEYNLAKSNLGLSGSYIAGQIFKAFISRSKVSYFRSKYSEGVYDILNSDFAKRNKSAVSDISGEDKSSGILDSYLRHNIRYQGFNQILHYEDHSSMQSSVEMRSPFIDYRIMELAFSLPVKSKFSEGITKRIMRETFENMLPGEIIHDNGKIGFATPFDEWTGNQNFSTFIDDVLDPEVLSKRAMYRRGSAQKIRKLHKVSSSFPLWRILNLELWIRAYGITNL